jgi:DNA-binding transcriptional LysR family regulator
VRSAADATAQTRAAAEPSRIIIGYTTGLIVTPAFCELHHRYPDTDVRTLHLAGSCETRAALLGKRVDALVTRLPFHTDQLHVRVLYGERRVLVVPIGHRLAGKEFVTLGDIADEPLPRMPQGDPVWSAFWHIDPRPDGSPAPDGPLVETVEDKFEVIAAGEAVAITAGPRGGTVRPDLTTVPLRGVEPSHVVLATRANDRNRLVAAFRKSAQAHLTGPRPADSSSVPPTPSLS